ncbi:MAG TPA: hypothetical protein DCL41_06675 [Bdellovibrionales bacterium]|nr:hypothetical protein [Pseudobdellovibrionaceae bacterium]HAG91536.1 hypothetical protein [Bdellovibrionales bacterium]|tara:strand:+ start:590 stop:1078 length:489 start_codon:yes stop_codon:yes gene_type:complete
MEIFATTLLIAGMIDDLRSQKIHNKLILALVAATLIFLTINSGFAGIVSGGVSFLVALAFAVPLTLAKVLGGGDMKLFAVFGLATNIPAVLGVAVFSLFWGALLGVVRAGLGGQLKGLILSTTQLLWTKGEGHQAFRIPYSVALLLGWMTHLTLLHAGMSLW